MQVTFTDPINQGLYAPFKDPTNFSQIPETSGVYIYGLKLCINKIDSFIPLYVGTAKNLRRRLRQHYLEERTAGNSKKEIFNLSNVKTIVDIQTIYTDMVSYDSYRGKNAARYKINSLIWFNHNDFFDFRLKLNKGTSTYLSNSGHLASIYMPGGDLDKINSINQLSGANKLKNEILNTKSLYDKGYYFAYAELLKDVTIESKHELFTKFDEYKRTKKYTNIKDNGWGETIAKRIENATKEALKKIKIHTTAKADGNQISMEIDLSKLQNVLVNVGNHNYNSPLIIHV